VEKGRARTCALLPARALVSEHVLLPSPAALVDLAAIDALVPRDDLAALEDALASIALAAFDAQQGETQQC